MYQAEMQQGICVDPVHASSYHLSGNKLSPVLEAIADASYPEEDDNYEDDASDER